MSTMWNSSDASNNSWTLTESNLRATRTYLSTADLTATSAVRATDSNGSRTSGKLYFELVPKELPAQGLMFGLGLYNENDLLAHGETWNGIDHRRSFIWYAYGYLIGNGWMYEDATLWEVPSYTVDDVLMFAVDLDSGKLWVGKNGNWVGGGNPAAGTGAIVGASPQPGMYPVARANELVPGATGSGVGKFSNASFSYPVPSGFIAWADWGESVPDPGPQPDPAPDPAGGVYLIYTEWTTKGARSTDGITWTGFTSSHAAGGRKNMFASAGAYVYMIGSDWRPYKSLDGETWQEMTTFVGYTDAIFAVNGAIYLSTRYHSEVGAGVWVSTDNGESWYKVHDAAVLNQLIAADGYVFGCDEMNRLIRNQNNGTFSVMTELNSVALGSGDGGSAVYLGGGRAILVGWGGAHGITNDYGATWTVHKQSLIDGGHNLGRIARLSTTADLVSLNAQLSGVYRRTSSDGGATWSAETIVADDVDINSVDVFAGRLIIPGWPGVLVSDDNGVTLYPVSIPSNMQNDRPICGIALTPSTDCTPMWTNHFGQLEY